MFVGDALTTRSVLTGEVGPGPAPFTLDLAQALASLERLERLNAGWVLPGHGQPWRDGAIEAVRRSRAAAEAAAQKALVGSAR